MHEDRSRSPGRNLGLNFGDLVERLPAESTSEVAKEDEQDRRLVDEFQQRPARFCLVLTQDRDKLFLFGEFFGYWQGVGNSPHGFAGASK